MTDFVRTNGKGDFLAWPVSQAQKEQSKYPERFFAPVLPSLKPEHDALTQTVVRREPTEDGDGFHEAWAVLDKTFDAIKSDVIALLADLRWQRETGGIEVGGLPVRTDRETQGSISRARQSFKEGDLTSVRWKLSDAQRITLGEAQLDGIAGAVTAHVAACFDAEGDVADLVFAAADIAALTAIDINAEFETAYTAAMTAAMS